MLSSLRQEQFERDGFCVAGNAVTTAQLSALNHDLQRWVGESRGHQTPYGETSDKRPRFDVENGHCADNPRLRRINNPAEISHSYYQVAFDAALVDMVADLIGPNVKFLHSKVNLKLANTETRVGYHQDFSYVPHTNPDVVTALLLLDDMTLTNGCLLGVPASHREGQCTLWRERVFTGEVGTAVSALCDQRAIPITGRAGDVCLMHAELLHGSLLTPSDFVVP